jgi:hypothetical protein
MKGLVRFAVISAAAVGLAGCATAPPRNPTWSPADRTAEEAAERLRDRSMSFRTARGVLELLWHTESGARSEGCGASLSWIRPDSLRIRGTSAAFFTVFDLAADAQHVRLDIPREGVAVVGRRDDPAWDSLPLSARELQVALLADPFAGSAEAGPASAAWVPEHPGRLQGPGWILDLHPDSGWPLRWVSDDGRGREILWHDWSTRDGVPWPLRIELVDPLRAERLEVTVGRLDLDSPVPAERFRLGVSAEREVITPEEAKDRWEDRGARLITP